MGKHYFNHASPHRTPQPDSIDSSPCCTLCTLVERYIKGYSDHHCLAHHYISLPELVDFNLFGKTILVVNKKLKHFFGRSAWEVRHRPAAELWKGFAGRVRQ